MSTQAAQAAARPTWDVATDEQILEEIDVIAASGMYAVFAAGVEQLLCRRGLWVEVQRRLVGRTP